MNLSPATLEKIDKIIPRYPQKRSAVMPLLQHIQDEVGYISREAIEWIATKLDLEPINVWEVVTFYPSYREKPVGKIHIRVCRTLPCALVGAYKTCARLQELTGAPLNGVSEDGQYSIEWSECLASCGSGPVALVGDDLHENITCDKAEAFLEKLK